MHIIHKKIIGSIHLIVCIASTFYGLLTKKNNFDKIYLIILNIILLKWIYNDGYCFISHNLTVNNSITYKNKHEFDDMYIIFDNKYNNLINYFLYSTIFITTLSLFFVYTRNNYSNLFSLIACFIYISYRLILKINDPKIINFYTHISKISTISIILLILNKEKLINLNNIINSTYK